MRTRTIFWSAIDSSSQPCFEKCDVGGSSIDYCRAIELIGVNEMVVCSELNDTGQCGAGTTDCSTLVPRRLAETRRRLEETTEPSPGQCGENPAMYAEMQRTLQPPQWMQWWYATAEPDLLVPGRYCSLTFECSETWYPSEMPTDSPTELPSGQPTEQPSEEPSQQPSSGRRFLRFSEHRTGNTVQNTSFWRLNHYNY